MAARRKITRRSSSARRSTTRRSSSTRKASSAPASTMSSVSGSSPHDLAAMYLSILIVGVAGIILLVARPTQMMQKVIGILLIVLGLWGLMMKK